MSASKTVVDANALLAELARLQAENDKLKAASHRAITCKISEKGALSVYGLGRFPVTLYASQWERLMASKDMVLKAITDGGDKLVRKEA